MKNRRSFFFGLVVILGVMSVVMFLFFDRASVRWSWHAWMHPALPPARPFVLDASTSTDSAGRFVPTSTTFAVVDESDHLPSSVNLAVPYTLQAPTHDWGLPYQETCEEAALLMVDAYFNGRTGQIPEAEADRILRDMVAFQEARYGMYKDTSATQTARLMEEYFPHRRVSVYSWTSLRDVQAVLARGLPVIVPAYGKVLRNPYFRHGGPLYHMVVIRGYTSDGMFVVNEPGTRNGDGFLYSFENLFGAAHDWHDGRVMEGDRVFLVVEPIKE